MLMSIYGSNAADPKLLSRSQESVVYFIVQKRHVLARERSTTI